MKRKLGIFDAGFGRKPAKPKVRYQPDPATLQKAVEEYMHRLIATLVSDQPQEVTIDCTGVDAIVNSLVGGSPYAVQTITPPAMEGIIEGTSVDLEPASVFWDYFQRLFTEVRQAKAESDVHCSLYGSVQSMTLRLQSSESGRGTIYCRFSYDS